MKIKIGFTKPKAWFVPYSWAIRFFYKTPYSHVYLEWYSESIDCRLIYEAAGSMIHFTSPSIFDAKETVLKAYTIDISDDVKKKMMKNCVMRCGIPYAVAESVGMGLMQMAKWFGIKLKKNPFGSGASKSKCSELVYDVLMEILSDEDKKILLQKDADQDIVSPLDIDNFLSNCAEATPVAI